MEMKEAYVTYKTAKLLKEKGFDCGCTSWYIPYNDGDVKIFTSKESVDYNHCYDTPWLVSRPTHQMAIAWLREIKNIIIVPEIHTTIDPKDYYWGACIYHLDKPWDLIKWMSEPSGGKYEGYNKIIEAAIKYSLENLI